MSPRKRVSRKSAPRRKASGRARAAASRTKKGASARPAGGTTRGASAQGAVVVVATTDAALFRAVARESKGAAQASTAAALQSALATGARAVLIDARFGSESAYELIRRLRPGSRARFALLRPGSGSFAGTPALAIAKFAGAETVMSIPPRAKELRAFLAGPGESAPSDRILAEKESGAAASETFRERVLRDLAEPHDPALLAAISDPETRLFSSAYGAFAFDQDFKRAARFGLPLSIALVGFEGEASTETLLDLAGLFLNEVRDTDTLARFGVSTFLFILPNTLVEGARAMMERLADGVRKRGLRDLVDDPLVLTGGAACAVVQGESRQQLFERAERAFQRARNESLAAVVA